MSWLCSGVSETPSLAWHVVIYNDGEYILVIKCIGYKQNHGADPDWLPLYRHKAQRSRLTIGDLHVCFCNRFFSRLFFYVHFGLGPCGSSHQRQMDLSAFFAGPLAWSTHGRSPLNETRAGLLEFHWSAR